jgi:hypothetical protein
MLCIDAIGEVRIERHRHGDIAEGWHLRRGYQGARVSELKVKIV